MDKDYKNALWGHHGEQNIGEQNVAIGEEETRDEEIGIHDFLNDVFVQPLTEESVGPSTEPPIGEGRPEEVETFFRLLEEADQDLWSAKHMRWHATEYPKDEFMRHPSDSPAWKHLDNLYADFASEIRNVRLGLASDGFNPFGKMRNDHSTWHVVLSVYNLPPWMCMKQQNLLLSLLILGPRSPSKEIDVYMRPLIDELNELWEKDASVGQRRKRTLSSTSSNSQWKKKSIFYELPYWRHLLIRHNLDVMHIEKNICDSVVGTLLDIEKSKDGLAARADLEVLNIRRSQHPRREGNRTFLPPALFTLKREEKTAFCKVLSTIWVPDGYSSNLSLCVYMNERKIHGLKSHDCHVLMQQLLLLAIRPVLPKAVTMVLLELSAIFRQLCSKKESKEGFKQLNSRVALTLCQLEKIFPPTFSNIMVHLRVHLADEAALAWPVQYRWMYLQMLKRYVCNKGRPKGSIAEAYLVDECLSFCSMYLRDVESRRTRRGRNEDGIGRGVFGGLSIFDSKGCYMGYGEKVELDLNVIDQCHRYILNNCDEVNPFRRFRIKSMDDKHKNQNCGVLVPANVPGVIGQVNCYGRFVDMFEVKYCGHANAGDRGRAVMLFKCEWVNNVASSLEVLFLHPGVSLTDEDVQGKNKAKGKDREKA
ncbi:unnamed protein product [Malus baccata var. baccata]